MEMTLSRFGLDNIKGNLARGLMPVGILVLVAMMVLPLPVIMLDTFFVLNIVTSLLILMVALHTNRPLDFSSFPSLLLIATVLRLGLNVASTRVVLGEGHNGPDAAGKMIEAFGAFVIAGNYAVGIFVFVILVIINLVVITRGAGRISEVSARFTLDAMPGKQMAIDADLNAGVLDNEEAKRRRADIAAEADFYGAMDGASKFVKGDAIAAILILIINIVGGLIIGLSQHDLPVGIAAQNYILLSIGDGLVAQIPSLMLAIATAIIVTRVSSSQDMAEHIGSQVNLSRAWFPVAGVLLLLGLIPGMPSMLFLPAAVVGAYIGYRAMQREKLATEGEGAEAEEAYQADHGSEQVTLGDIVDNAPVSLQLGYGLIDLVGSEESGPLISRITGIRRQVSRSLGFVLPAVRVRDDLNLPANRYRIRVGQKIVGEDQVYTDKFLAIPGDDVRVKLDGIEVRDPSFGMEAVWIEAHMKTDAEARGYVVVTPESVIATHLSQMLYKFADELIGQDDVQHLCDNLAETSPSLVQSVVPKLVPLHQLTAILRTLLSERMPISDLRQILENLAELSTRKLSIADTAEALRPGLASLQIQQIAPLNSPLPVITLSADMEQMMISMVRQNGEGELILENNFATRLLTNIAEVNDEMTAQNKQAVMVVSPAIRRPLAGIIRQHIDDIIVLSFNELPDTRKVDVVATINGETDQS
ncbi:MAG: Flagellar biosynthesis protein FlhA [SAR116 cluster bacterium MED-G04]|jgi:flagellar biosynthesis protein FlhA|nr:MAG: Flagellar biosynthesis protein FlhA [SAR116 cluster bacterium MED-G04]|tara:strand:- start:4089 stop:6191 length:2103 start_codon:yes stop_codon:yes gene_type:complete